MEGTTSATELSELLRTAGIADGVDSSWVTVIQDGPHCMHYALQSIGLFLQYEEFQIQYFDEKTMENPPWPDWNLLNNYCFKKWFRGDVRLDGNRFDTVTAANLRDPNTWHTSTRSGYLLLCKQNSEDITGHAVAILVHFDQMNRSEMHFVDANLGQLKVISTWEVDPINDCNTPPKPHLAFDALMNVLNTWLDYQNYNAYKLGRFYKL